jgi:predicted RecB family endonuclease
MSATKLREEAQRMNALALKTLGAIMRGDGQDAVKLAAAREVLDRAHGKPKSGAPKARASKAPASSGMTVIVKRFSDVTPEEEAAADATERGEW